MLESGFIRAAAIAGAACLAGCADVEPSTSSAGIAQSALALAAGCDADERRLFVPTPDPAALEQIAKLEQGKKRDRRNAVLIRNMIDTPQASWFIGGTPREVERGVRRTMKAAARQGAIPVLVAYNLPFRDCAQYSTGGAVDTAAYEAWIDGFVSGIGKGEAIVILEPDGLGIIPYNTSIYGAEEWCKPTVTGPDGTPVPAPGANADERYAQLQYAATALNGKAVNASVYLDGTHSSWLGVGEAAHRIHRASHDPISGAPLTRGFFLNVSNYELSQQLIQFGTWISMCTAFATNPEEGGWRLGNFSWCKSQYNPETGSADYSAEYAATVTTQLQDLMGSAQATLPFVIDTGRNGRGPLDATRYSVDPYNQPASVIAGLDAGAWCNARGAGLGLRPTLDAGEPLVDALLWVKIPGHSDGSCDIAGGARAWDYSRHNPWNFRTEEERNHFDPLWGLVDPVAGAWFPEQAVELALSANPPL